MIPQMIRVVLFCVFFFTCLIKVAHFSRAGFRMSPLNIKYNTLCCSFSVALGSADIK